MDFDLPKQAKNLNPSSRIHIFEAVLEGIKMSLSRDFFRKCSLGRKYNTMHVFF